MGKNTSIICNPLCRHPLLERVTYQVHGGAWELRTVPPLPAPKGISGCAEKEMGSVMGTLQRCTVLVKIYCTCIILMHEHNYYYTY